MTTLTPAELASAVLLRDLADPAQGPHALQILLSDAVGALAAAWRVRSVVHRTSPLVSVADNYDRLGFSADAVTRDRRYSKYVSPARMLRSHTSAAIPGLLDDLSASGASSVDELWALPGLVHRRDAVDRTHVAAPHQLDLWRITDRSRPGVADLEVMVDVLVGALLPGARWRASASPHPYTEDGRQIDVLLPGSSGDSESDWLELAECGLVAPHVLSGSGLDPERWGGLALGLGLDRALMLRKGIDDIRVLRSSDPRVVAQMADLAPWRPVSAMPPVVRDLSIVVADDVDEETLGDAARTAMEGAADDLERVELIAVTPHAGLPPAARERLGTVPGQVNALVRLVLRPLERTLTDAEANAIRDRVYLALHAGPRLELIAG